MRLTWNVKPSNEKVYTYSLLVILRKLIICKPRCNWRLVMLQTLFAVRCIVKVGVRKHFKILGASLRTAWYWCSSVRNDHRQSSAASNHLYRSTYLPSQRLHHQVGWSWIACCGLHHLLYNRQLYSMSDFSFLMTAWSNVKAAPWTETANSILWRHKRLIPRRQGFRIVLLGCQWLLYNLCLLIYQLFRWFSVRWKTSKR